MVYRPGQRLGNYQLVRLLGRGGFAEVYLGEQVYLHTQAALKVLHVQLLDEHVQAFLREAQYSLVFQPLAALLPELAVDSFPQRETSEHEQLRLWETVLALLVSICERQPVLLVFDDVHWADSGSCELLGYLVRRLVDYPLLIIGTCREHELPSAHPLASLIGHLQREHTITVTRLAKLTDEQIGELVADVSEPFNRYIQHQAAGNPFFAEEYEMARDLAQRAFERFHDALQRETVWKDDMPYPTRLRRTLAGDPVNLGRIYALQAMIANSSGQLNAAVEYFQKALAVYEQYHCRREIGLVWCNLGDVYIRKADYGMAETVSRRALEIAEQIGEIPMARIVTINLGMLAARAGNLVEAKALYLRALVLADQVNDYAQISLASTYLALVLQDSGDMQYQQGLSYLREARSICIACHAACDLQRIESDLVLLSDSSTPQHAQ
jgi:tetratricopeptide (TPR) repeat protein